MTNRILTWDWKDQPDPKDVEELVKMGYKYMTAVPDTECDQVCWVFGKKPVNSTQAQNVWNDATSS